jgi:anti-sigma B factor antagonist
VAWFSPNPTFGVRVIRADRSCRLVLDGELDLASTPGLALELSRLERRRAPLVIVDLRGVTFMDLACLQLLLSAHGRARNDGRGFAIVRGPRQVQRLMTLTGVEKQLHMLDDPAVLLSPGRDEQERRNASVSAGPPARGRSW